MDTGSAKKMAEITLDTMEVIAPAGPAPYQPTAPRTWNIKHTRIALSFNMKEKTANAREWIKLNPYYNGTDSLILDAKGMKIDTVKLQGKRSDIKFTWSHRNEQLRLQFPRSMYPSDSIELYLRYTAMPYTALSGGSAAISDDRGLYFVNTDQSIPNKPVQIWTQGETESNSHWMITIDKPNTRFTIQMELTVPDTFKTLSNGALIASTYQANHMRTDTWRTDMPIQPYAVMLAVGKFAIVKDSKWRNKEVSYYVEPEFEPYAKLIFKNTPEMMEYFSRRTGVPYPWNKYSQVVVRDYVSGAMENTTASLFGEFVYQDAREIADKGSEDIVAHELFHQWFGDYVTAESWSNVTVNESFANYGEQLWRMYKYGAASADELAYNDLQIYIYATRLNDPQLVRYYYDNREEVFDAISYNKGGAILRYLNRLIGDTAFDRAMNGYLTKNALGSAEAHSWRMAVEEATGQDWNWFFNQWYYHAGHPELKVVYDYNDSLQQLTATVTQEQEDSNFTYILPVKTAIIYGNEKTIVDWKIDDDEHTFVYNYKNGVKPVLIPDYTHVVVGEVRDGKKPEQWLAQYLHSDDYVNKRLAVAGAGKLISDSLSQVLITMALSDKLHAIRRLTLATIKGQQTDRYRRKWTPKVIEMATTDSNKLVRAEAFEVLGAWKVAAAKPQMAAVLYDSSYTVAGNALEALSKIDLDTAYILAKLALNTEPRATLETAAYAIIGKKGADEDIVIFEKKAPYVFGAKRFALIFSLSSYMSSVKSDVSFRRAAEVFTALVLTESMKAYRAAFGGYFFQVAARLKGEAKSDNKEEAAIAQKRMEIIKPLLQRIVNAEKDTEAAKDFKKMMKNNFE